MYKDMRLKRQLQLGRNWGSKKSQERPLSAVFSASLCESTSLFSLPAGFYLLPNSRWRMTANNSHITHLATGFLEI